VVLAALLVTAWLTPVPGHVTRPFDLGADPFQAGHHRGADFAAPPGTPVRAVCDGRVAVAARVGTNGRVVTIRCGPWRVTALPLATVAVRPDERVRAGDRIGTAGSHSPDHAGLHLGVRRATDRFGYVDPLRFLTEPATRTPPVGPGRPARPADPGSLTQPEPAARPAPEGARAPRVRGAPVADSSPIAPWPVWAGLGLALAGAFGAVAVKRPRSRRAPLPRASPEQVR
jgi:murein DD-endopeptidase MepM/ murein hydrolase activator NlpD